MLVVIYHNSRGSCSAREIPEVRVKHIHRQRFGPASRAYHWRRHSLEYNMEMDFHHQVSSEILNERCQPTNVLYDSVPIAVPAFVVALLAIPKDFPYHNRSDYRKRSFKELMGKNTLDRIDIPGTILILFATLALTSAFEEADKRFPWRSAYVITLLTLSGLLWIALITWERYVTLSDKVREPILPWRFLTNRQMLGILLYVPTFNIFAF